MCNCPVGRLPLKGLCQLSVMFCAGCLLYVVRVMASDYLCMIMCRLLASSLLLHTTVQFSGVGRLCFCIFVLFLLDERMHCGSS